MHLEKYKKEVGIQMILHDIRKFNNYKNKDIDLSKTHLNYNLHKGNAMDNFNKRKDEIYIYGKDGKKKDKINYLDSICVHYPKSCSVGVDEFFMSMYKVLSGLVGEKNVISGIVHNDEKSPHMHFKFMPVLYDEKRKRERLCHDDFCDRNFYKNLHPYCEKELREKYNIDCKLQDKDQNKDYEYVKSIYEYKAKKISEDIDRIEQEYNDSLEDMEAQYINCLNQLAQAEKDIKAKMKTLGLSGYDYNVDDLKI